ncbi:hypothetical protein ACFRI7_22260 [Streptomyces sp. NPDC056716]|uniref:hypothetical protein n=1 Tax=unclassified Streptomyces TaxID=2593676 RepID=UPI003681B12D
MPVDRFELSAPVKAKPLMDALGLDKAHIEGESMGAQLVFEFGMRYPERSGKLIMNTGLGWRVRLNDEPESPEEHDDLADRSLKVVTEPTYELMKSRMEWLVADKSRMTDEMIEMRLTLYRDPDVNAKMRRWFKVDNPEGDAWDLNPVWAEGDLKNFQPESLVFWTEHNPGEPAPPSGSHQRATDRGHAPRPVGLPFAERPVRSGAHAGRQRTSRTSRQARTRHRCLP